MNHRDLIRLLRRNRLDEFVKASRGEIPCRIVPLHKLLMQLMRAEHGEFGGCSVEILNSPGEQFTHVVQHARRRATLKQVLIEVQVQYWLAISFELKIQIEPGRGSFARDEWRGERCLSLRCVKRCL